MSQQSTIGNLANLKEGEILLPNYVLRQADGIYMICLIFP